MTRSPFPRVLAGLRELLLREAALAREKTGGEARRAARRALAVASERRRAAEVLLVRGSSAEAVHLGVAAGQAMVAALAPFAGDDPRQSASRRTRTDAFRHALEELGPAPSRDEETTPAQTGRLRRLVVAQSVLEADLLPDLRSRREILYARAGRGAYVGVFGVALGVTVIVVHLAIYGVRVTSSSDLGPLYAADRALDGDTQTDWVAGPGEPRLEIELRHRRHLHHLAILNGHILTGHAASGVLVQCVANGGPAREWQVALGEGSAVTPVSVALAGAICDRLILHPQAEPPARGAAISEVTLD